MTIRPILYLEPVGGIAGDMFLAAALDLGVSLEALEAPLRTLGLGEWSFRRTRQTRHDLTGTHVAVVVPEAGHAHRGLVDIEALIATSQLSDEAKLRATRVFRLLGEAEAKVHGVPLETLHFHEVGAVDSIVDICGAAVALELLENPQVYVAPPPLGSGTVRIAHGMVPVPVPATLELLRECPVRFEGVGELTTPTGAALLRAFAQFEPPPQLVIERVGYGLGTKDLPDRANVLRASLGRSTATAPADSQCWVLECNLDDCTPQVLGFLVEHLLAAGALDAWVLPAVMKKGRPGHLLGVLVEGARKATLTELVLRESTTLGVRSTAVDRTTLDRRVDSVSTPWGPVRVKVGLLEGAVVNAAPEFEDCRALARSKGVPLKDVQAAALTAWRAGR
jgi:uncharacterized protein (TIGR00299 family) protein